MATTAFGSLDPRTQKVWSQRMFKYALKNMWLSKFMGTTPDSVIQNTTDLTKRPGDKVTFELLKPLEDKGQGNDGTLRNNSEALSILNWTVGVHERGHSVASNGKISEQRTATNIRQTGRTALGMWLGDKALEEDLRNAIFGLYNGSTKTGYSSTTITNVNEKEPSTNRILYIGQSSAGVLLADQGDDATLSAATTSNALFGTKVIERAKREAMDVEPHFRPVTVDGEQYLVMLIGSLQAKALRADSDWLEAQRHANVRGRKNPIFSGAMGIWDGVVIHEYQRAPYRTGDGGTTVSEGFVLNSARDATTDAVADGKTVQRAVLLGAQAGLVAWAQRWQWHEDFADIGQRKPEIAVDGIYGVAKAQFNEYESSGDTNTAQEDFATLAVDTQVDLDD